MSFNRCDSASSNEAMLSIVATGVLWRSDSSSFPTACDPVACTEVKNFGLFQGPCGGRVYLEIATSNKHSGGWNGERAEALQALMRHQSSMTTERYINIVRQIKPAVASLHVPQIRRPEKTADGA